jgi:hypothetical protein
MKKRKKIDSIAHQESLLQSSIRDIELNIDYGILPLNPTRKFSVGERVCYGAHKETYIREIFRDGLYYRIENINVQRERDKPPANEQQIIEWHDLLPYIDTRKNTSFCKEETYRITQLNSSISSLLNMVYHSGVDFDVEYQREHVWSLDDKHDLIASIFDNIDIGKFVFIQRLFSFKGKLYKILDGKQRLRTIAEFYEDRFKYNGFYYSELSGMDKNKFENYSVFYGYLINPNKKTIFEAFIKLNTCGKPMAKKHIDRVKKLLDEI